MFSQFLEEFPPTHEVQIKEVSSWSCAHGVERWRSDCGCCIGGHGWNQKWRKPLRETLDWLRDQLANIYQAGMSEFADDPWALRNKYIDVLLDRSQANVEKFFKKNFIPKK